MKSLLAVLSLPLLLAGCAGTISSVSIPSTAPWQTFETAIASPYNDLSASPVGANINVGITPNQFDLPAVVGCQSDQGPFLATGSGDPSTWNLAATCIAGAPGGATNITALGLYYLWHVVVEIDPGFTTGSVEIASDTVGTLFALSFNKNGTALNIGAGVSQGILPGPSSIDELGLIEEWGHLLMIPHWNQFGDGSLCADGSQNATCANSTTSTPVAVCVPSFDGDNDLFAFKTNVPIGTYSLSCGSVPVNLTMNTGYKSVGACIDTNIKNSCTGLKGQQRSACTHAQISVCHASFNVPGTPK